MYSISFFGGIQNHDSSQKSFCTRFYTRENSGASAYLLWTLIILGISVILIVHHDAIQQDQQSNFQNRLLVFSWHPTESRSIFSAILLPPLPPICLYCYRVPQSAREQISPGGDNLHPLLPLRLEPASFDRVILAKVARKNHPPKPPIGWSTAMGTRGRPPEQAEAHHF